MRHYIAIAVAISFFAVPWLATQYPSQTDMFISQLRQISGQIAAVVTHNPRTVTQLQDKYAVDVVKGAAKIRVLLMPGHEPGYGGAEYINIKERELNVALAEQLSSFLVASGKYDVIIPRTNDAWHPTFSSYFQNYWADIVDWQKSHKEESLRRVAHNASQFVPKVYHNDAPLNIAYRLYGITKWSNENAIDIAIHIHFNDHPGHRYNEPGQYNGFSIYVPESQYLNSTTTRAIAETVFKRLAKYNPVSDLPGESEGIVDESELIAIGANNTADAASLLIEYAYVYEPQIVNPEMRSVALRDLAYQTYLGLEDFFTVSPSAQERIQRMKSPRTTSIVSTPTAYDTLILPYTWNTQLTENSTYTKDVYALQTALVLDGVYPPINRSKNDCPRTGKIGPCTKEAIKIFQTKYGLESTGTVGPKTLEKLNGLYSIKSI